MYDFTNVRIPKAMLAEAEQIAEALRDLPAFAHLGEGRGKGKGWTTATIHLALERGLASLRAELAKPTKARRKPRAKR